MWDLQKTSVELKRGKGVKKHGSSSLVKPSQLFLDLIQSCVCVHTSPAVSDQNFNKSKFSRIHPFLFFQIQTGLTMNSWQRNRKAANLRKRISEAGKVYKQRTNKHRNCEKYKKQIILKTIRNTRLTMWNSVWHNWKVNARVPTVCEPLSSGNLQLQCLSNLRRLSSSKGSPCRQDVRSSKAVLLSFSVCWNSFFQVRSRGWRHRGEDLYADFLHHRQLPGRICSNSVSSFNMSLSSSCK